MLNINKLIKLQNKLKLVYLCKYSGLNYNVVLDRIRKKNELKVNEAEQLTVALESIATEIGKAIK